VGGGGLVLAGIEVGPAADDRCDGLGLTLLLGRALDTLDHIVGLIDR